MSRAITWPCISTIILKDVPDTALTSAACDKLTEGDLPLVRSSQSGIQRNVSRWTTTPLDHSVGVRRQELLNLVVYSSESWLMAQSQIGNQAQVEFPRVQYLVLCWPLSL